MNAISFCFICLFILPLSAYFVMKWGVAGYYRGIRKETEKHNKQKNEQIK